MECGPDTASLYSTPAGGVAFGIPPSFPLVWAAELLCVGKLFAARGGAGRGVDLGPCGVRARGFGLRTVLGLAPCRGHSG